MKKKLTTRHKQLNKPTLTKLEREQKYEEACIAAQVHWNEFWKWIKGEK